MQGNQRDAGQPRRRAGTELGEPVIVGAEGGRLELGVADAEELEREARVEHLGDHAVAPLVAQAGVRIPASRSHLLIAGAEVRGQLLGRDVRAGEGRDPERRHVLAHEVGAGLTAVADDDAGGPLAPARAEAARPQIGGNGKWQQPKRKQGEGDPGWIGVDNRVRKLRPKVGRRPQPGDWIVRVDAKDDRSRSRPEAGEIARRQNPLAILDHPERDERDDAHGEAEAERDISGLQSAVTSTGADQPQSQRASSSSSA